MQASAKDLRFNVKALLDSVSRGEEVIITFRGKARAKLVPYEEKASLKADDLFGLWRDNEDARDVDDYVRNLRRGRT